MRLRVRKVFRKIQTRPHLIIWVILGFITSLLLFAMIFVVTNYSLDQQNGKNLEQLSEINNIAGNIPASNKFEEFTKNYQQTSVSLNNLNQKFNEYDYQKASLLSSLLHPSKSTELETSTQEIAIFINDNKSVSENLAYQLTTLEIFINYDPVQDFSNYGVDKNDDLERISRAKTAFTALSSDLGLNKDITDTILDAGKALDELKGTNDTQIFFTSISHAKTTIADSLSSSLVKLKGDVSAFYNQQLYQ